MWTNCELYFWSSRQSDTSCHHSRAVSCNSNGTGRQFRDSKLWWDCARLFVPAGDGQPFPYVSPSRSQIYSIHSVAAGRSPIWSPVCPAVQSSQRYSLPRLCCPSISITNNHIIQWLSKLSAYFPPRPHSPLALLPLPHQGIHSISVIFACLQFLLIFRI